MKQDSGPLFDRAIRVTVPEALAEVTGAVLMDLLGPFELESAGEAEAVLTFYVPPDVAPALDELIAALPPEVATSGRVRMETRDVARDWVDGWKDHFRPTVIGEIRIRPPWEPPLALDAVPLDAVLPVEVIINPGLGFGTGLHPTTRGTLLLLQATEGRDEHVGLSRGPLVDAGTGSGILAIAAAKLGWGPVFAFDNDPVALTSARENVVANDVGGIVEVHQANVAGASPYWFEGATVLANMTLEPVLALLRKIASEGTSWSGTTSAIGRPRRMVVSGILAGAQEQELVAVAGLCGLACSERIYEDEWVSVELLPVSPGEAPRVRPGGW